MWNNWHKFDVSVDNGGELQLKDKDHPRHCLKFEASQPKQLLQVVLIWNKS